MADQLDKSGELLDSFTQVEYVAPKNQSGESCQTNSFAKSEDLIK